MVRLHDLRGAGVVVAAGICAALHVGKLPPALPALQAALGVSLVQSGFLLSLVQLAGMGAGLLFGLVADALGLRRCVLIGLALLALASVAGAWADGPSVLLLLRAVEGAGFLMVSMPAPALIRRLVAADRVSAAMGWWGAYMPAGTALALLLGPFVIEATPGWGWQGWWLLLAALTALMWAAVWWRVPADPAEAPARPGGSGQPAPAPDAAAPSAALRGPMPAGRWTPVLARLRLTLGSTGPWLVAGLFALYSSQWLALIGFLPTVYAQAGVATGLAAVLTALVAAVNMLGNIAGGRLMQWGVAPRLLLQIGYAMMAVGALLAFAPAVASAPWARFGAFVVFSAFGGMIPATLFALAIRLAPAESAISSTVGWVQQCSAFGQLVGPPIVAWVAARAGGWAWTGVVTAVAATLGLIVASRARALRRAT